ncbi:MAG: hypothetical protein PHR06_06455 [Candidatus Cloacimonetes bacterium]|nr:hypothetical protein [Candidatus Cloacimonadota bacterium]
MRDKSPICYEYIFKFTDGEQKSFKAELDYETLELINTNRNNSEETDWLKLSYFKCPNCTLKADEHRNCPVAESLNDIIKFFGQYYSTEQVEVTVVSENRDYFKKTSLQRGISSLMGIYTVTSGCPILAKLKPMVRYHLPFASMEETMYRGLSMYLVDQFYRLKEEKSVDWSLTGLAELYNNVHICNETFFQRLKNAASKDANLNALIILDTFASFIHLSVDDERIRRYKKIFMTQD